MALAVGIDLGTTNSVVAQISDDGIPVVIPNALGNSVTPSVICFKNGELLYGEEAKEMQALGLYPIAAFFKRQMGDELFIFHVDGVDYSATELSTLLLKKLIKDAGKYIGEKITDAVITVPAYFRDSERRATIAAGKSAGINVLQVINEPTAAAIAYGVSNKMTKQRILVYDLGGGTFDVTLLEFEKDQIKVQNSDGDHQLGGKDWDDCIVEYLASQFKDEYGIDPLENSESIADLLIQAEDAKKKLTSSEKTIISITYEGKEGRYPFDRATFNQITASLMERTISMSMRVLEDEHITTKDIDGVLLVGGSTRMPMVHQFIEAHFSNPPMKGVNVDTAVALGAALVAEEQTCNKSSSILSLKGRIKTIDVTNHSLGMIAINQNQKAYINSIILPKNKKTPCNEVRPYQHKTRRNSDNKLEIFMTQGETDSPEDVAYLGCYIVHDIPHPKSCLAIIDVSYQYDLSGTVQVEAKERTTSRPLKITIEPLPSDVPQRFMLPPELQEEIEHVTAYLAFDLSGSMSGQPLIEAKKAALGFLDNSDLSHSSIGIVAFSDCVKTKLKACQNAKKIKNAINELIVCETGVGNQADPFEEINNLLKKGEGHRFGIILADGVWSNQSKAIKRAKKCHEDDINIIAIGFGGADKQFLRDIASSDE
ncbi:MAG: Hsp70 family protein, partial [Endozoicomonadaceae bacterium]|nr:Hsp70 family protein [Endozoicomonadaceae bacterium]